MNVELHNVSSCFKSKKLSLNLLETKWSLFHLLSKRKFLPQTLPNIVIENMRIKREKVTKFLGYILPRIFPGNMAVI